MLYLVNVNSFISHSGGGTNLDTGPWYQQLYETVVDGFNFVVDALDEILLFLGDVVLDLKMVVEYTAVFMTRVPSYLGFLPSQVVSVLLIGFGIAVVYMFLGRK